MPLAIVAPEMDAEPGAAEALGAGARRARAAQHRSRVRAAAYSGGGRSTSSTNRAACPSPARRRCEGRRPFEYYKSRVPQVQNRATKYCIGRSVLASSPIPYALPQLRAQQRIRVRAHRRGGHGKRSRCSGPRRPGRHAAPGIDRSRCRGGPTTLGRRRSRPRSMRWRATRRIVRVGGSAMGADDGPRRSAPPALVACAIGRVRRGSRAFGGDCASPGRGRNRLVPVRGGAHRRILRHRGTCSSAHGCGTAPGRRRREERT